MNIDTQGIKEDLINVAITSYSVAGLMRNAVFDHARDIGITLSEDTYNAIAFEALRRMDKQNAEIANTEPNGSPVERQNEGGKDGGKTR